MIFDDDEEYFRQEEPQDLLEEIRNEGFLSERRNMSTYRDRERMNHVGYLRRHGYGSQDTGIYSMESFIVEVLELDMRSAHARNLIAWNEATDYIIEKAVETINSSGTEIHFTPQEDTDYKKIKFIYDKLANDLKQMICRHLKLSPCPRSNEDVIAAALLKYPLVFPPSMTIGFKLKTIEDYIESKMKSEAKGGRRRRRSVNRKRSGKQRDSKQSKKRRYSRKRKY